MAVKYEDTDYLSHIEQLSKSHLKKTEWKLAPLENPQNDFFGPLLARYLDDLDLRHKLQDRSRHTFASIIRRAVLINSVHDLIETLYTDTIGIKDQIKEAEAKLALQKERQD